MYLEAQNITTIFFAIVGHTSINLLYRTWILACQSSIFLPNPGLLREDICPGDSSLLPCRTRPWTRFDTMREERGPGLRCKTLYGKECLLPQLLSEGRFHYGIIVLLKTAHEPPRLTVKSSQSQVYTIPSKIPFTSASTKQLIVWVLLIVYASGNQTFWRITGVFEADKLHFAWKGHTKVDPGLSHQILSPTF